MKNLAKAFLDLDKRDFAVLRGVEKGMRRHDWVPLDNVVRISRLSPTTAERRLRTLVEKKLVYWTPDPYVGYQIGFNAYDLIALGALVDRDIVRNLGDLTGVGKESVVYDALGDEPLVIKFHREGMTSFKHVRRVRDHLKDVPRCAWILAARLAARKEFQVLSGLYPIVTVPRPVGLSHHALVLERLNGVELYKIDLLNPKECLDIVLEEVASAWRLGFVHADLSEYNVFIRDDQVVIIDWPQAVHRSHPRARELLERDLTNLANYFKRSYRIDMALEDALGTVMGNK